MVIRHKARSNGLRVIYPARKHTCRSTNILLSIIGVIARRNFSTFANVRTLPVILKEAGYRTCSIGKYHVEPEATYHFDHYLNDGPAKDTHNPVGMAQNVRKFIADADKNWPKVSTQLPK